MSDTITTGRGEAPVYHAGTLAYLDSFGGMIKVTVTRVVRPGIGYHVTGPDAGEIETRVNETRAGYTRGEIIVKTAYGIVPRNHHHYRGGSGRINSLYAWA